MSGIKKINIKNNPLNHRIKRDFKKNIGRYFAVFIMLAVSISILSGFLSAANGSIDSFNENRRSCLLEDGQISVNKYISKDSIGAINDLGITIYENFNFNCVLSQNNKSKDENINKKIRIYASRRENNSINLETLFSGKAPIKENEIALDRLFGEKNDYSIGDKIRISNKDYEITGFVTLPDYSALFEEKTNFMMDAINFGVGIISQDAFKSCIEYENISYTYSFRFDNRNISNEEKSKIESRAFELIKKDNVNIIDFSDRNSNPSISFVKDDLGTDVPMVKIMCYVFVIIMAFVFSITIISTIEEEAVVIGSLLANGYNKHELIFHYMKLPVIITLTGALIGNIIGYGILQNSFKTIYYSNYSLPKFQAKIDLNGFIITTLIPICIMIAVNYVVLHYKLSYKPLNFLRNEISSKKSKSPMKLPNFKFITRFRIRIILQNKIGYLMLIVGIILGSFILLLGLCLSPVLSNYMKKIENNSISEYRYILKQPLDNDEIFQNESVLAEKFTAASFEMQYKFSDENYQVSVFGISKESEFIKDIKFENKDTLYPEVYASISLLNKLHLKSGELISVTNSATKEKYKLRIIGKYNFPGELSIFAGRAQINSLLGYDLEYYNGVFSNTSIKIENDALLKEMSSKDIAKANKQIISMFDSIAPMFIVIAFVINISLMYLLTKIVIEKNSTNISYMKVFGYCNKEINRLYLNATTIVVILGLIISIPLCLFGVKASFELAFMKINSYVDVNIEYYYLILIMAFGFICYLIVNYLHVKRVRKYSLGLSLKSRE